MGELSGKCITTRRRLAPKPRPRCALWVTPIEESATDETGTLSRKKRPDGRSNGASAHNISWTYPVRPVAVDSQSTLQTQLIGAIEGLRMRRSWWVFAPSRLGRSHTLDLAAAAFIAAQRHGVRQDTRSRSLAYEAVAAALHALRTSLDASDDTLIAIALLSPCDGLMGLEAAESSSRLMHWQSIGSILLTRPRSHATSDVVHAMLSRMWECTLRTPYLHGRLCPFDGDRWIRLEPVRSSSFLTRLSRANELLLLRLPRLMTYVRLLEQRSKSLSLDETFGLADELMGLQDETAENEMLHHLSVVRTVDPADLAVIGQFSFAFESSAQLETAVLYWQNCVNLTRLCLRMTCVWEGTDSPRSHSRLLSAPETLRSNQLRMVTNIVMSWQYAFSCGMLGGSLWFRHLFPTIWGALAESGVSCFRDKPIDEIRSWIILRLHDTLAGWDVTVGESNMDDAAASFIGGPWKNRWLDM